jgi:tetratricopeptide (TPR) repeat protein
MKGVNVVLPPEIRERLDMLCSNGDDLLDAGDLDAALCAYRAAEELIPEPKEDWEAATWIYTAIGDTLFYKGVFRESLQAFQVAIRSPDGLGNPYIHLRLGQCQFELGNLERAADELTRAYMGEGKKIFEGEDLKYFEFLATRIQFH